MCLCSQSSKANALFNTYLVQSMRRIWNLKHCLCMCVWLGFFSRYRSAAFSALPFWVGLPKFLSWTDLQVTIAASQQWQGILINKSNEDQIILKSAWLSSLYLNQKHLWNNTTTAWLFEKEKMWGVWRKGHCWLEEIWIRYHFQAMINNHYLCPSCCAGFMHLSTVYVYFFVQVSRQVKLEQQNSVYFSVLPSSDARSNVAPGMSATFTVFFTPHENKVQETFAFDWTLQHKNKEA